MGRFLFDLFNVLLLLLATGSVVKAQHGEHAAAPSSFRQGQVQQGEYSGGSSNGRIGSSNGYSSGAYSSSSNMHGVTGHEGGAVRISNQAPDHSGGSRTNNQGGHSNSESFGQESRSNVNLHGFGETNTEHTEENNEEESGTHSEYDPTASLWKSLGESFASLGYMASKSGGGASVMRQAASLIAPLFTNLAQLLQMQSNPSRSE